MKFKLKLKLESNIIKFITNNCEKMKESKDTRNSFSQNKNTFTNTNFITNINTNTSININLETNSNKHPHYIKKIYVPKTEERSSINIINCNNITNINNNSIYSISNLYKTQLTNNSKLTNFQSSSIMNNTNITYNKKFGQNFNQYSASKKYIYRDRDNDNTIDYEELKPDLDKALKDYKYDSFYRKEIKGIFLENENNQKNQKIEKTQFDKLLEKKFNESFNSTFIKLINKKKLESYNEDNKTKISINTKDYDNPFKSYSIIKKNEAIHNNMIKNYNEVHRYKCNEYIKKTEEFYNTNTSKVKNIKITTMPPKKYLDLKTSQESHLNSISHLNSNSLTKNSSVPKSDIGI
jgi:hypothetical protein